MITFAEITSSKTLRRIKNYLLLDLETTGPDPELDSIIELGMVRVTDGEIVNQARTLINPETAIPPEVTAATGIADGDVASAPTYVQMAASLSNLLIGEVVVAEKTHMGFIRTLLEESEYSGEIRTVDLRHFAEKLLPDLPDHEVETLASCYDLTCDEPSRVLRDSVLRYGILRAFQSAWDAEASRQAAAESGANRRFFAGVGRRAQDNRKVVKPRPLTTLEIVESVAAVVCLLGSLFLIPSVSCLLLLLAAAALCPFRPVRLKLRRKGVKNWMYAAVGAVLIVAALLLRPAAADGRKQQDAKTTPPPYIILSWNEPGAYGEEVVVNPDSDPPETYIAFRIPAGNYRVLNNNSNAATISVHSDNEDEEAEELVYEEPENEFEEAIVTQRNGSYTILGNKSQTVTVEADQYVTLSEKAEKVIFQYLSEIPVVEEEVDESGNPVEKEPDVYAYVTGDEVRMRRNPSVDAYIMTTYDTGKQVVVLGVTGDWTQVKVDNRQGYIYSKYLSDTNPLEPEATAPAATEEPAATEAPATEAPAPETEAPEAEATETADTNA